PHCGTKQGARRSSTRSGGAAHQDPPALRAAVAVLGPEGVPVLGLELPEQRDRIVRGGEDQRVAGGERLERAEDRGVAHRVRDRLHVQLGDALVVLAAGAALLGRALLDRLLPGAVDLDVRHGRLLRWGRWVVGDILRCCPRRRCRAGRRAGPVPPRPVGATPPRGSPCCAPSSPSARPCRPRPSPARPGCTRTPCAVTSNSCWPTGTWPGCAHAAPAAAVPIRSTACPSSCPTSPHPPRPLLAAAAARPACDWTSPTTAPTSTAGRPSRVSAPSRASSRRRWAGSPVSRPASPSPAAPTPGCTPAARSATWTCPTPCSPPCPDAPSAAPPRRS